MTSVSTNVEHEPAPRFFTRPVILLAFVNLLGGFVYGYNLGHIPMYSTYVNNYLNCPNLDGSDACLSALSNECAWNKTTQKCRFSDGVTCNSNTSAKCSETSSSCQWSIPKKSCSHRYGWVPLQVGVYSASFFMGGVAAVPFGHIFLSRFGRRRTILGAAVASFFLPILTCIGFAVDEFALVTVSRVLIGAPAFLLCVACPLYVKEMGPPPLLNRLGPCFQIMVSFSISIAALFGLTLQPDSHNDLAIPQRVLFMVLFPLIPAGALCVLAFFMDESRVWIALQQQPSESDSGGEKGIASSSVNPITSTVPPSESAQERTVTAPYEQQHTTTTATSSGQDKQEVECGSVPPNGPTQELQVTAPYDQQEITVSPSGDPKPKVEPAPTCLSPKAFIFAILLSATNQSLIGVFVSYLPTIIKQIGIDPLLGNYIGQLWAFLCSLLSLLLAGRVNQRLVYVSAVCLGGIGALIGFLGSHPSITTAGSSTNYGLGIFSTALFLFSYQSGNGPNFWLLASDIFEPAVKTQGSSLCNMLIFALRGTVNLVFPIGVEVLSGGPAGNQAEGVADMLLIMGIITIALAIPVGILLRLQERHGSSN